MTADTPNVILNEEVELNESQDLLSPNDWSGIGAAQGRTSSVKEFNLLDLSE